MKQLWSSVLLKDTSAVTSHAGIRTHILTTPELESDALNGSAMTIHLFFNSFNAIFHLELISKRAIHTSV